MPKELGLYKLVNLTQKRLESCLTTMEEAQAMTVLKNVHEDLKYIVENCKEDEKDV